MEHEELWDAIMRIESRLTRLENQLEKIRTDLDGLRHNEIHDLKTDSWQLENRVSAVEHSLQSVERMCR